MDMPSQLARSFDPATVAKIKKSALISLGGFLVAAVPMLLPDLLHMAQGHPVILLFLGQMGSVLVNGIKEWMSGQSQP